MAQMARIVDSTRGVSIEANGHSPGVKHSVPCLGVVTSGRYGRM